MSERFDLEALDPDDPFELDDGNLPHLAKHAPFTAEDAVDAWTFGDPLFYPAAEDGPAIAFGDADTSDDEDQTRDAEPDAPETSLD